jgi:hypothetical protein
MELVSVPIGAPAGRWRERCGHAQLGRSPADQSMDDVLRDGNDLTLPKPMR